MLRPRPKCPVCTFRPSTRVEPRTRANTLGWCRHCREMLRQAEERGWTRSAWLVHLRSKCTECQGSRGVVHPDTKPADVYLCGTCRHRVHRARKRAMAATTATGVAA